MKTAQALQARQKAKVDSTIKLVNFLQKNPGLSIYDISKKLEWTSGKVSYYILKLAAEGFLKTEIIVEGGRAKRIIRLKTAKEMLSKKELEELKKI